MVKRSRFFNDQTYHFQTLRALNDIPYGGADTSEILETIKHIKAGEADSWYNAWERTGDRVSALACRTKDPISRGRAHLRAHNYYRTAEFFLAPHDPRRAISWKKNVGHSTTDWIRWMLDMSGSVRPMVRIISMLS